MTPKGGLLPVFAGIIISTVVTFLVAAVLIDKKEGANDGFEVAKDKMVDLKGKKSSVVKTSV